MLENLLNQKDNDFTYHKREPDFLWLPLALSRWRRFSRQNVAALSTHNSFDTCRHALTNTV